MWMIQDNNGRYFSGYVCGCIVWKNHWSRGFIYTTKRAALKDLYFYELNDCEIINKEDECEEECYDN